MLVAITTGLRASELAGLTRTGIHLGDGPHLECHGKGRKNRVTPLLRDTAAVLAAWLEEDPGGPGSPLFPTRRGTPMSQNAIEDCIKRRRYRRSNLAGKHPTPHILRHTCAVRMLHSPQTRHRAGLLRAQRPPHALRHFKKLGMFVGSGAVEAGCKSIVAQRCKLSGMRWTVSGATGILTLRCLEASDRWEQIRIQPTEKPAA